MRTKPIPAPLGGTVVRRLFWGLLAGVVGGSVALAQQAVAPRKDGRTTGAESPASWPAPVRPVLSAMTGGQPSPRTAWFQQARFGLFIHWGLYAIPGGEWKGREIQGPAEWIMRRAPVPVKEYEKLAAQFNPVKFDAEQWVLLAKEAGQKYIVIGAKHHDGFAMFGSKASAYNVVDATPFQRDVLKELAGACAKHGLPLGFYYSQAQDWHEPDGAGNTWDFGPEARKDFDRYLRDKAMPQVRELLTGYGKVALIWFDTPQGMTAARADGFVKLVRELQGDCLINGRLRADRYGFDYLSTGDNRIPAGVDRRVWEVPATMNDTWGFKAGDRNYKSPADLIGKLVDIVSKGGNYLLNVGPTAQGEVPPPSVQRLREMGAWLKVNGEAIYGTGPTPFGYEFGSPGRDRSGAGGRDVLQGALDWRCTTKPGRLYIHLLAWPSGPLTIPGVTATVARAYLLADPNRAALAVRREADRVTISLPPANPGRYVTVLCIETR